MKSPEVEVSAADADSRRAQAAADPLTAAVAAQRRRSEALLHDTPTLGTQIRSEVLPFRLDISAPLPAADEVMLAALEKQAAAVAVRSLISLAKANDIDHLGGGLELIPALLMTLGLVDYESRHFAIEHGHTSIGYYGALAALGFLPEARVINAFRRSLDIAGHVSWVPGGTPIGSGRLGVTIPVATGLALGARARAGTEAFVICHCGDAGWISGQALNGFNAASFHQAPIVFVMHRNGIQLSGPTDRIMNKDPRPIVASLGVEIMEIASLHDRTALFSAYREAIAHARNGQPVLIYPVGLRSTDLPERLHGVPSTQPITVRTLGEMYGITREVEHFAGAKGVALETRIWIPGSLMSFRDVHAMLECVFYVNHLPGGEGHHDGGMKGRDGDAVLANPMLRIEAAEAQALDALRARPKRIVVTEARPAKGTPNLLLAEDDIRALSLPGTDKWVTARAGTEAAYAALARKYPARVFIASCDLNPSTKLGKAAALVPEVNRFELSIEEQAATLITNGLAFASREPQLNVFATFGAFFEGIAREGFEFWRYQRNLTGVNDGLNVVMHLSHVGACTGRDHFSGWSLDWINLALGYMPYLRRFYAPADARSAFLAIKDAASAMGGHIVGIPRDNLPVLTRAGGSAPLWEPNEEWTPVTPWRQRSGAKTAILALGAPAYLAGGASDRAADQGVAADVFVINGFPLPDEFLATVANRYRHVVTVEDGLIGGQDEGLRGFAAYVATRVRPLAGGASAVTLDHFGITDPQVAPSEHFLQVWEHYGLTEEAILASVIGGAR